MKSFAGSYWTSIEVPLLVLRLLANLTALDGRLANGASIAWVPVMQWTLQCTALAPPNPGGHKTSRDLAGGTLELPSGPTNRTWELAIGIADNAATSRKPLEVSP